MDGGSARPSGVSPARREMRTWPFGHIASNRRELFFLWDLKDAFEWRDVVASAPASLLLAVRTARGVGAECVQTGAPEKRLVQYVLDFDATQARFDWRQFASSGDVILS